MSYLGENIPKLGFGLMRLPMQGDEVDIELAKKMTDEFIKAGFTYFDTAYGYLGGKSELAVNELLAKRYPRESYQLATKLPAWAGCKSAQQARDMFYTSLERTHAGYFDFYLLHNLGEDRTQVFEDYELWDFGLELKEKGLIKHLGFSFHDTADRLEEVLAKHSEAVEFVQLQINYADWTDAQIQSEACLRVAEKYKKPVIIMEPVKGGLLANPPKKAADLLKAYNPEASYASWALRFAASQKNIITVLSGMSDMAQMLDNLATMKDFKPISPAESELIDRVRQSLADVERIPCTACGYCIKGCPSSVAIPGIFKVANKYLAYDNLPDAKGSYSWETRNGGRASACIACGACESVCPQHIQIIKELSKAKELFE